MINITLPDGSVRSFPAPITGRDLATNISTSLVKSALAIKVDGQVKDLASSISKDATVEILTLKSDDALELIRHDTAHVMAEAVQELFPGTQVTIGPNIEHGFYYDFYREQPFSVNDLESIEKRMREIIARDEPFVREVWQRDEAVKHFESIGEKFKAEIIRDLPANEEVSVYRQGKWYDLCRGPHLPSTGKIGTSFKLMKVAGAYWRGDSNKEVLQRIYGTAWRNKDELAAHLHMLEEAERRDHRKIGKELGIYHISEEVGSGLPLWLPKGAIIREELEHLAKQEERADGYQRVFTPQITKEGLYYTSGHLPYYKDDMYAPIDIEGQNYYLRPMNCPHHHQVYSAHKLSYRDMPLRLAEYGHVYRYESSGALSGLMRARGFCQNDAHIYCRFDQAEAEFIKVMHLHERLYKIFDITDFYMRLSLPDMTKLDKYVNQPEEWRAAVEVIRSAMQKSGLPYKEVSGEAAFYGPKVDFNIKSAIGVEYSISTNQLDFLATQKFDLTYTGEDGGEHPVYVIHRAPLGSHERFVGFLLEHYAGALPVWLSPIQVRIIPIADRHIDYANAIYQKLFGTQVNLASGGLRPSVDAATERMQKKIRNAQLEKIPYMLVVGDSEVENQTVAVRHRSGHDFGSMKLQDFIARIAEECNTRTDQAVPVSGNQPETLSA